MVCRGQGQLVLRLPEARCQSPSGLLSERQRGLPAPRWLDAPWLFTAAVTSVRITKLLLSELCSPHFLLLHVVYPSEELHEKMFSSTANGKKIQSAPLILQIRFYSRDPRATRGAVAFDGPHNDAEEMMSNEQARLERTELLTFSCLVRKAVLRDSPRLWEFC